jgi:hypothetical protein
VYLQDKENVAAPDEDPNAKQIQRLNDLNPDPKTPHKRRPAHPFPSSQQNTSPTCLLTLQAKQKESVQKATWRE